MKRAFLVVPVALLLVTAGCGGGSEPSTTGVTPPVASAPDATAPPPDATAPAPTPTQTVPSAPRTDTQGTTPAAPPTPPTEPDAGDEQPIRVPATFTIAGGRLSPRTITVPPFLAVEVSAAAPDGGDHVVVVKTPGPHTLSVHGGRRAAVRLPGLRAGSYAVELDGRPAGTLVAGGEVGP